MSEKIDPEIELTKEPMPDEDPLAELARIVAGDYESEAHGTAELESDPEAEAEAEIHEPAPAAP
ncbi:MAG: hypothetical protein AAF412_14450, partial [Pseudomonadota bacterium]